MSGIKYLKAWREYRGYTQERLAERVEPRAEGEPLSGATISRYERGKQNYRQETLEALAVALDCTVVELLSRPPAEREFWEIIDNTRTGERSRLTTIIKALTDAA